MKERKGLLVAAGTGMMLLIGVLYAWSVFRLELAAVFPGFTASQLSLNFTLTMCSFCIGGFLGGRLTGSWGRPRLLRLAAVLLALGYGGASFMGGLPEKTALVVMYLCYGVLSGLGVGIGYNVILAGVTCWTQQRMGLVSGVLLMGFGLGSLVLGALAQKLAPALTVFGVFRLYAAVLFAALFAGSFLFGRTPEAAPTAEAEAEEGDRTTAQMLRSPFFLVYFLWNVICSSSGMLVINSAAAIAVAYGGAASLGLLISLVGGLGRPVVGAMMDRVDRTVGLAIMNGLLLLAGLALVVTHRLGSPVLMMAGLLTVGVVYGGGVTTSAKVIRAVYGQKHYAVNFSVCNFVSIPASFLGPLLSGLLQDKAGGSFGSTFRMLLILSLVGGALLAVLAVLGHRENRPNR